MRRLDRPTRERIIAALEELARTGYGDLIWLQPPLPGYRLRVLLDIDTEAGVILVHDVQPRGRAYRRP